MGIDKETFRFLKDLRKNNEREWFHANKARYKSAEADVKAFTDTLISKLSQEVDESLLGVQAKDCTFRIYRDVRFSKNKLPYKTGMGAYITSGGRKAMLAGYYLHVEPGSCMLAGGAHMPPPDWMKAIRSELAYNGDEFRKIIEATRFKKCFGELQGDRLKTSPKDYDKDHPEIELLRMKGWTAMHTISDKDMMSAGMFDKAVDICSALKPLNDFLNMAQDGDEEKVTLI